LRFDASTVTSLAVIAAESVMRAEVERLVEEIKQSVGLLRRHL
jgi:predicted transcriptional regulator